MSKSNIIGSNNQTPGRATAPSTLNTDGTTTTGLLIQQGSGAPSTQVPFRVVDSGGSTIFEVRNDGHPSSYGMKFGATNTVSNSRGIFLNGRSSIPFVEFPDGTALTGARWWGGTAAPSSTNVGTASIGDLFFRSDTTVASGTSLYICTVAGSPGTWVAIA